MATIQELIAQAATQYGIDPATMAAIAQVESRMDPNARNPRSSAGGLFQQIDANWSQYGKGNKFDPSANVDAAGRYLSDAKKTLSSRLGRDPTPGELYLAHQQGPGGASKLLSNPSARAADLVGLNAVRLNGGRPDMSAAEFAGLWDKKLGNVMGKPPQGQPPGGMPAPPQWAQQFPTQPNAATVAASPPPVPAPAPPPAAPENPMAGQIANAFSALGSLGGGPSAPPPAPPPMQLGQGQNLLAPFLAQYMATKMYPGG